MSNNETSTSKKQQWLADLRRRVAEGHASGTAIWTGGANILAKAHKAAGL